MASMGDACQRIPVRGGSHFSQVHLHASPCQLMHGGFSAFSTPTCSYPFVSILWLSFAVPEEVYVS